MTARVLVTDGNQRSALAVVRSLGRAGYRPYVVAPWVPALSTVSRYCVAAAPVPGPASDPRGFVEEVRFLGRRWGVDVLIPATDSAMAAALGARELLAPMSIPAPAEEDFLRASDRATLLDAARAVGISVPEQAVLERPEQAAPEAERLGSFPLTLKPALSWAGKNGRRPVPRVRYCNRREELEEALTAFPRSAYPLLLQRTVEGPGMGVFLLIWDGELRAAFAHRRIREKPPSGGTSVLRESIALDPELVERSRSLLERFCWRGVAMVEYKSAAEAPVLMEVNGRFWGSLQLAVDAGVDFPRLLVDAALGKPSAPLPAYRVGVRTRWEWGEVDHLAAILLGRSSPAGTTDGRVRSAFGALRGWLTPARLEILRTDDPRPFARESLEWMRDLRSR